MPALKPLVWLRQRWPQQSLQRRLSLSLVALLTLVWLSAAGVTALLLRHAIDAVFDASLQETAQRILPLAVSDILSREEEGVTQRLSEIRSHDEFLTYIVRDAQGRVLIQSHDAVPAQFPAWTGPGFSESNTHRYYHEMAVEGSIRLTLAVPLSHRRTVAHTIQMGLSLPLLIFLPLVFALIVWVVRSSLKPLRLFTERLATRHARDLSLVPTAALPSEIVPLADSLNQVLLRLDSAFTAERSFAANAAHELRTPLAGAIAQTQRLYAETQEASTQARAKDIETTLKRLTRLAESLLQLARAEGARLRLDKASDLGLTLRIVADDFNRMLPPHRLQVTWPANPVLSTVDPDVCAIVYRTLIENALRHGTADAPVTVHLDAQGLLVVTNDCAPLASAVLATLRERFTRGNTLAQGSGLGLAIVQAVADRMGSPLVLLSPQTDQTRGFEARLQWPIT